MSENWVKKNKSFLLILQSKSTFRYIKLLRNRTLQPTLNLISMCSLHVQPFLNFVVSNWHKVNLQQPKGETPELMFFSLNVCNPAVSFLPWKLKKVTQLFQFPAERIKYLNIIYCVTLTHKFSKKLPLNFPLDL